VHIDRVSSVAGLLPRDAYWCTGRERCSRTDLPHRISKELIERGHALFSEELLYLVFVRGAGPVMSVYRREDGLGTVAVIGDGILDKLAACADMTICPADIAVAHIVGHLLGIPDDEDGDSVMQSARSPFFGWNTLADSKLAAPEIDTLRDSVFLGAGTLSAGMITLSTDSGTVYDVAFGDSSAMVLWGKNIGPKRGIDTYYQKLFGRVVKSDGTLSPVMVIANTPAENGYSLGDREASLAYDSDSDAFQVVFQRYWSDGSNDERKDLRTRRFSASTGDALGAASKLTQVGTLEPVETDIAYSPATDSFVVTWAKTSDNIGARGSSLYAATLSQDGATLSAPIQLGESAKYPSVTLDSSRDRFLITWTHKTELAWQNTIVGRFVGTNGAPIGASFDIRQTDREAMLSEAAYDPNSDRFLVSYWFHGGGRSWDVLSQPIRANNGSRIGEPMEIASGPAEFQYDPAIAYSPFRDRFLISYSDDPGEFFDGLGNVRGQWADRSGQRDGFPLFLRPWYDAHARTEVATHPVDDLAAVAWSGTQGIAVDLFQSSDRRDPPLFANGKTSKVMVIAVDPFLPKKGKYLRHYMGWNDYTDLTLRLMKDFQSSSGGFINYQIMAWHHVEDFPAKMDGFRYDEDSYLAVIEGGQPGYKPDGVDYAALLSEFDVCKLVQEENLSEVWLWGATEFGWDEFAFKIPGDAVPFPYVNPWFYRPYNLPDCGKTLWVMGWNYAVGEDNALHSYGHRIESILSLTVGKGKWYENEDGDPNNPWRLFSLIDKDNPGEAGVGNIHFPPNGQSDYDYANQTAVVSASEDWKKYPNLTGVTTQVSCEAWGCTHLGYMKWYLGHLPRKPGTTDGFYNNWWQYVVNYDQRLESAN